ncbi:hypothetical protein DPSP01_011051 [Paraphaeosphaeria sporulosa]
MPMRRRDRPILLSLHDWLTTSDSEPENFLTPLKERSSPYFDRGPLQASDSRQDFLLAPLQSQSSANFDAEPPKGSTKRSKSDSVLVSQQRTSYTASKQRQTAPRTGSQTVHRPCNDAEIRPDYRNTDDTETRRPRRPRITPLRARKSRAASSSSQEADSQTSSPGIRGIPSISISAPILMLQEPREAYRDRLKAPLKSSMKHTPNAEETPAESTADSSSITEHHRPYQSLRRLKPVDFKGLDAIGMRTVLPLKPWVSDTMMNTFEEDKSHGDLTTESQIVVGGDPSCLRPEIKSEMAVPALTKTDVHVVTLTPTYEVNVLSRKPDISTTTPTMQIIKSADSCHEVVWDDIPAEDNKRVHCRISLPSRALQTLSSARESDLRHVNSNLCEWDWGRGPGLESFAPQVVVFPDDESHAYAVTCVEDDDGNITIRAPSNSQETTGAPSYATSTPGTASSSRPPSQYVTDAAEKLEVDRFHDSAEESVAILVVPDAEVALGTIATLSNDFKKPLADRRLSNVDDSEMKFRGHRDSVTIARSRLLHDGEVSPELLEVQKYSSTAKRRMHARNREKSEEGVAKARTATVPSL